MSLTVLPFSIPQPTWRQPVTQRWVLTQKERSPQVWAQDVRMGSPSAPREWGKITPFVVVILTPHLHRNDSRDNGSSIDLQVP